MYFDYSYLENMSALDVQLPQEIPSDFHFCPEALDAAVNAASLLMPFGTSGNFWDFEPARREDVDFSSFYDSD